MTQGVSEALQLGMDHLSLGDNLALEDGPPAGWTTVGEESQPSGERNVEEELRRKDAQIARLAGTLSHWRAWAGEVAVRYAAFNPDVARPARRIYVGGLPTSVTDAHLRQFFNDLMIRSGGAAAPGFPLTSCKLYPDKNYAFVEFRTVEEASNCMALDGVQFMDSHLRIRRPNNYTAHVAAVLGPHMPDPTMDLTPLNIVKTVVPDSPSKLFIGGLPCDWSEDQVKEMLQPYGELKAFNLVMDKNTGNSKGYAFAELQDVGLTDSLVQNLNGKPIGNKFLTVKRALAPIQY